MKTCLPGTCLNFPAWGNTRSRRVPPNCRITEFNWPLSVSTPLRVVTICKSFGSSLNLMFTCPFICPAVFAITDQSSLGTSVMMSSCWQDANPNKKQIYYLFSSLNAINKGETHILDGTESLENTGGLDISCRCQSQLVQFSFVSLVYSKCQTALHIIPFFGKLVIFRDAELHFCNGTSCIIQFVCFQTCHIEQIHLGVYGIEKLVRECACRGKLRILVNRQFPIESPVMVCSVLRR